MIFEMESQSQAKLQNQPLKLNGLVTTKNLLSQSNGCASKTFAPKPSTSDVIPLNGVSNSAKSKESNDRDMIGPQLAPRPIIGPQLPPQRSTAFIGPQLPQKIQEKNHPRLIMHPKNGKVSNGNSLVPYDGSSEDDDADTNETKNSALPASNPVPKSSSTTNTNGLQKQNSSTVKEILVKTASGSKDVPKSVNKEENGAAAKSNGQNGTSQSSKSQNGSTNNGTKLETNGKDKWHNPIRVKTDQEERVPTKAASSSIKGWQVSKDTPSPTAATTPNGWSVTDNKSVLEYFWLRIIRGDTNVRFILQGGPS